MRLEIDDPKVIRVYLSRRNLEVLLAKLDGSPAHSACTLVYETIEGRFLVVHAEPDAVHYANPERASPRPGEMHPDTEKAITKSKKRRKTGDT